MEEWKKVKKELLRNKAVRKEYVRLGPQFLLISKMIGLRIRHGLTQKELAKRIGTKQSAVSRFESGKYNPSVKFLEKTAVALGAKLSISLK